MATKKLHRVKFRAANERWFEIQIDSDLKNLEFVSDFIAKTMRDSGAKQEKDIFDVQLAVDEALTNVIEHAYSGQKGGEITIRCMLESPREFTVKICDHGKSFDSKAVLAPNTEAKLEERKVGGLGIYFMKKLMQSVKYASNEKGNELTMTKQLHTEG
jgi:serine/threonine-protein kinase RsbW